MARIRTIKPEFWTDDRVGECSVSARLLFIACWTFADDHGGLDRSAKQLKAQAFPYDVIDCEPLVQELIGAGLLIEYAVNGKKYLHIKGFATHQKIEKPGRPRVPLPEPSPTPPRALPDPSALESKGMESKGRERKGCVDAREAFGFIRESYPEFSGRQDWLTAEHHARLRVENGDASWEQLLAGVERYRAYVASGGASSPRFVLSPARFFSDADRPWSQPWKPPPTKAEHRTRSNLDAAAEFMRNTDPGNAA